MTNNRIVIRTAARETLVASVEHDPKVEIGSDITIYCDNVTHARRIGDAFYQLGRDLELKLERQVCGQKSLKAPRPINIIFDGPPGPEPPRFVEIETDDRSLIRVGQWIKRPNGRYALRIKELPR